VLHIVLGKDEAVVKVPRIDSALSGNIIRSFIHSFIQSAILRVILSTCVQQAPATAKIY